MASQTSHRSTLATSLSQQPKTSMDPTVPKNNRTPKSNPTTTTTTTATATIKNISHHFANLYAGHKAGLLSRSHPHVDIHLQTKKGLSNSTVFDTPSISLTKSNSHHGRRSSAALADVGGKVCTRTKVREKDKKSWVKKSSPTHNVEVDVEKAIAKQKFNEAAKKKKSAGLPEEEEDLKNEFEESEELKRCDDEASEMGRELISNGCRRIIRSRRKSFCCSEIELSDFFSCSGVKVVAVDMPPFMQIHAVDCARKACDSLEKFTSKNLALTLKKEFDGVYGPAWHCIVGTSFGSFVTHSVGGFLYFSVDQKLYILLFKTTVQRASD